MVRAELTRSVSPGTAYLLTRLYLGDGTVLEQTSPGRLDLKADWNIVGREGDLAGVAERLRHQGWAVSAGR